MTIASARDLALIYFIIPSLIISAMPLIALYFAVRGLRIGRRRMMPYVHLAQFYASRIARLTHRTSERVAQPFVVAAGIGSQIENIAMQFIAFIRGTEAP
ncbi:MAG: hypothetical protein HZB53_20630 [Chloroflexi bacterium]|nr:hypothetical protein [Chloroflexota bacterium]